MKLKYLAFCAAWICIGISFVSCNDEDENEPEEELPLPDYEIVISDIVGIPDDVVFNKVKAEISGFEWDIIDNIEATFTDGTAILSLPSNYPQDKLCKVNRDAWDDFTGFWPAKTEDKERDARVAGLGDIILYNNDVKVGRLYLSNWEGTGPIEFKYLINFHYTDKKFTLSGNNYKNPQATQYSYYYEATFKRGWNVYAIVNNKEPNGNGKYEPATVTTTIPASIPLVWRYTLN